MIKAIISASHRISAVLSGKAYVVPPDHPRYQEVKQAIEQGDREKFIRLVDIPVAMEHYTNGTVTIKHGTVYYNDQPVNTSLASKIVQCMEANMPYEPLVKFLANLMQNPSGRAINEAYRWIEHECIKITEDGHWLGYKYLNIAYDPANPRTDVTPEQIANNPALTQGYLPGEPTSGVIYKDVHSGTIRQWIGKTVSVPRNTVDDNWGLDCSQGLHVGSSQYSFSGQVKVLVKVNPRDNVTIPGNETHKCRVCTYELVEILTQPLEPTPLYSGTAPVHPLQPVQPTPITVPPEPVEEETTQFVVKVTLRGRSSTALVNELDELNSYAVHDEETTVSDTDSRGVIIYRDMEKDEAEGFQSDVEGLAYVETVEIIEQEEFDDDAVEEEAEQEDEDDSYLDDETEEDAGTDGEEDEDLTPVNTVVVTFFGEPSLREIERVQDLEPTDCTVEDDTQAGSLVKTYKIADLHDADMFVKDMGDFRFVRSAILNPTD